MKRVYKKILILPLVLAISFITPFAVSTSSSVYAGKPTSPPQPVNTDVRWGMVETPGMGWDQAGHQAALSIGVKTMRVELRLVDDVTQFDTKFTQAAQDNIRLMPLLNTAAATYDQYPDPAAFAQFTSNMAARYGAGGTFWIAHPELNQTLAPEAFELINEPDIFIERDISLGGPQKYAQIVKASVSAGRTANPSVKYLIYGGGTANDNGVQWVNYMFSAVPDLGNYVDFINAHPYNGLTQIVHARDAFIQHGVTRDVWISEVGFYTDGTTIRSKGKTTTGEDRQVIWLNDWGNSIKQTPWIRAFFYFQYRDWQPGLYGYGLWHYDGSPKPSVSTYANIIAGN